MQFKSGLHSQKGSAGPQGTFGPITRPSRQHRADPGTPCDFSAHLPRRDTPDRPQAKDRPSSGSKTDIPSNDRSADRENNDLKATEKTESGERPERGEIKNQDAKDDEKRTDDSQSDEKNPTDEKTPEVSVTVSELVSIKEVAVPPGIQIALAGKAPEQASEVTPEGEKGDSQNPSPAPTAAPASGPPLGKAEKQSEEILKAVQEKREAISDKTDKPLTTKDNILSQESNFQPALAPNLKENAKLPGQAATQAAAGSAAQNAAPVPLGSVPIEIGLKTLAGESKFQIRLDPAELGRIDVKLDIGKDGEVKAHLTVDRIETLMLLQRDAKSLERAFEQAGLKPDGDIAFNLRDQNPQGQNRDSRQDRQDDAGHAFIRRGETAEPRSKPVSSLLLRSLLNGASGIDVRI